VSHQIKSVLKSYEPSQPQSSTMSAYLRWTKWYII